MTIPAPVLMTEDEARELTNRIRRQTDVLWSLLLESYERRAWEALGYVSWREYAKNEFEFGQSHVYRLLDRGRVNRALQEAAGLSPNGEIVVSESEAREIKPQLVEVTAQIRDAIEQGENPSDAFRLAVTEARNKVGDGRYLSSRKSVDRNNRMVAAMAAEARSLSEGMSGLPVDFASLDEAFLPEWIASFRQMARDSARFAAKLESLAQPSRRRAG